MCDRINCAVCAQRSESNISSCQPRATTTTTKAWTSPKGCLATCAVCEDNKPCVDRPHQTRSPHWTWTSYRQRHVCRAPISSSRPPAMYASVWFDGGREREDTAKGCNEGGDMQVHISGQEGQLCTDVIWQVKDTISAANTFFPRTSSLPTMMGRISYGGVIVHQSGSVYQFSGDDDLIASVPIAIIVRYTFILKFPWCVCVTIYVHSFLTSALFFLKWIYLFPFQCREPLIKLYFHETVK